MSTIADALIAALMVLDVVAAAAGAFITLRSRRAPVPLGRRTLERIGE
jgi:hypothetical protein